MTADRSLATPAQGPAPDNAPARAGLDRLRARVRAIEGGDRLAGGGIPLGIPAVDRQLPGGGLAAGALHQLAAADPAAGAATGFAAFLLGRLARCRPGPVLWCVRSPSAVGAIDGGELYGPGLARFGLDPARLVVVRARRDDAVLQTLEEALRCPGVAAALGEAARISLTASRRLQLAAEAGGVPGLLLRPSSAKPGPSAAATAWRIAAAPSRPTGFAAEAGEPGPECWRVELARCRGGEAGAWLMEWRDETGDLALSAPLRDRPDRARPAAAPA